MGRWHRLVRSVRELDRVRIDQSTAVLLGVAIQSQLWLSRAVHDRPQATVAGVVLCGAVATRRRWPLGALLVGCAAMSGEAALGGALVRYAVVSPLTGMLCFYGAGALLPRIRAGAALLAGLLVLLPQMLLTPNVGTNLLFEPVILGVVPWVVGRWVRESAQRALQWRERSEELDAARERTMDVAADVERIRIARELHDVIGHCLSVIVLQAGGARMVVKADPERAREAMHNVEQAGQEALAEVRHLLGVFGADASAGGVQPQPGMAGIHDLVSRARAAGLDAQLTVVGEPREISPTLALCAYRIVQEGLTNTIKHSAAGRAQVHVEWGPGQLELEIVDDGAGGSALATGGTVGHGIVGMRERAALHDGWVQAGPAPAGGYRVAALLPLTGNVVG